MILGALAGFVIFSVSGVVRWREADDLFTDGMKMMAMIGFIMIAAAGFAEVMRETGEVKLLVDASTAWIGNSKAIGALLMLLVGLLVTIGIGSSFLDRANHRRHFRAAWRRARLQPLGDRESRWHSRRARRWWFPSIRFHAWANGWSECRRSA